MNEEAYSGYDHRWPVVLAGRKRGDRAPRHHEGKVHPVSDLQAWVEQAGLLPGEVIALSTPPGMGALVAHVPLQEASMKERRQEE